MAYFLLGVALLASLLILARVFVAADPKRLAGQVRNLGGYLALFGAFFFAVTGRLPLALPLAFFGFMLLQKNNPFFPFPGQNRTREGQRSAVRTDYLEIELDHTTGDITGRVTKGHFAGRDLKALGVDDLIALWRVCEREDRQSAQILVAYLDRWEPDWRQKAGAGHQQSAGGGTGYSQRPGRTTAAMTVDEAWEVLGLKPGASEEAIRQAHRQLMKKFHPDQGGSDYIAAQINMAKDVLLGRRR